MHKKQVHDVWEVARVSKLPGVTTTVTIDLSKLTTRMHNNLIKRMNAFLESSPPAKDYYSQSGKLFRLIRDYFGLHEQVVNVSHINIYDITPEIKEFAYELALADTTAYLLEETKEYNKAYARRQLDRLKDSGLDVFMYGFNRAGAFKEDILKLRKEVSENSKIGKEEKYEKLQNLINFGGSFQLELII
jgi:hypothetical protein